jgi:cell division protein FtsB
LKSISKIARLAQPFARPEESLRAVVEHAPRAEALAAPWVMGAVVRVRPFLLQAYALRRRLATLAVIFLTVSLFVHVMFGVNGMVVYKQKRAEYDSLKKQIDQVQQENDRYTRQIHGLKSDQKSIEKEAREQLGYAKPGEYVYVPPAQPKPALVENHSARK